jgi:hypothetical protein
VKQRRLAAAGALERRGEQRAQEAVEVLRRAVVGVDDDSDRAARAELVPPTVAWTIPSEPASAKPSIAALSVCDDVTLTAGSA